MIKSIADKSGLSDKDAEAALNAFFASVESALRRKEKVVLVGFGTFEVRQRSERKGINPRSEESIIFPDTKVPIFKAGKHLKDQIK